MSNTSWPFIESEVDSRLGALFAGGGEGTAETSYQAIPKTNNEIDDAAFNRSAVRTMIVDVTLEVIGYICKNEGDARRIPFLLTATVAHGGVLPSSMGPYGSIYDAASPYTPLTQRSASEIAARVANTDGLFTLPVFFYAIDGTRLLHTVASAKVEYFDYPRPAATYDALTTLFSSTTNLFPLGDEFAVVVADGAAGRLAMKAGSYVEGAQGYLQAYATGLKERNVSMQAANYPPQPTS